MHKVKVLEDQKPIKKYLDIKEPELINSSSLLDTDNVIEKADNKEITDIAVLISNDQRVALKDTNNKVSIKNVNTKLVAIPDQLFENNKIAISKIESVTIDTPIKEVSTITAKDKTAKEMRDFSKPVFLKPQVPTKISAAIPLPPPDSKVSTTVVPTANDSDLNKVKIEYRNGLHI